MSKTILLLLLLFIVPLANALVITEVFFIGDSFEALGRNITLMGIGGDNDTLVICVNNQKAIVRDEELFNSVEFNFQNIENNYAQIELNFPSSGECDESCSNTLCFLSGQEPQNETELNDMEQEETEAGCTINSECNDNNECTADSCLEDICSHEPVSDCGYIVGKERENSFLMNFGIILMIIVIVLLIILIFKKSRKKR